MTTDAPIAWYCPKCSEWSFPGLSERKAREECFAVDGELHRWVQRDLLPKRGLTYPVSDEMRRRARGGAA